MGYKKGNNSINNKNKIKTNYTNLQQTDLIGRNINKTDFEEFGDKLEKKEKGIFRAIFQNANRLPAKKDTDKSKKLFESMVDLEVDAWLASEVGLFWPKVSQFDQ